jgi:subtilisin family serine protease
VFFARTGENEKTARIRPEQTPLKPRALARRARQGLALDAYDVPVTPRLTERLSELDGVEVRYASRWLHAVSVVVEHSEVLATISSWPDVERIVPVRQYRAPLEAVDAQAVTNRVRDRSNDPIRPHARTPASAPIPEDASSSAAWRTEVLNCCAEDALAYGMAENQVKMLGADVLHEAGYQGQDVLVGIFDGGFRGVDRSPAFQNLWDEGRIVDYWNFHLDNDSVFEFSSHGSSVLSCIAASSCEACYSGTAPKAKLALYLTEVVSFERIVEEDYWVAAAERADAIGVDIINTSLGYTTFDSADQAYNHSYADMDGNTTIISRAADWAASRGMLVVVSAGNQGGNNWRYISAPADGDSVLAVGATFQDGSYAWFSSYGPSSDGDIKPNVAAVGALTWVLNSGGVMTEANGTSFSAPLVAGAAASLWSAMPEASNMEIFRALEQAGHRAHDPNDSLGYGIPYLPTAWQHLRGRSDAFAEGEALSVWPNPVAGQTVWIWQGEGWDVDRPWRIRVMDRSGRVVYEEQRPLFGGPGHAVPINAWAGLAPGTYVLQVAQGEREQSVKIQVSR